MSTEKNNELERGKQSGVPYSHSDVASDTVSKEQMKAFNQRGRYVGTNEGFGASISDDNRLFYSTREPVAVWWIKRVAYDIWDNGFRLINLKDKDDDTLDIDTQKQLRLLKAKTHLPRLTIFERRYGTSILLLSYTGFGSKSAWEKPLYQLNSDGQPPKTIPNTNLLQITPYPWTSVNISTIDEDPTSIRCGLPMFYEINSGTGGDATSPHGMTATKNIRVHWTRITPCAPRLDEHPYLGVPAIDEIWDDLVGGRNAKWAAYESNYRVGGGFPVIKMEGTAAQNREWIENGGLDNFLNVRGYFVCNPNESFEFAGAKGSALNPTTIVDMYFTNIAAATGVAKNSLQGISGGRVTGGESDERQYFKSITLQQNMIEPTLRELIDRLIQTGQIVFTGEYEVEWIDPFEVNPQDKASIEFLETRTRALKTWLTINEVRAEEGKGKIDGGDVLMSMPGQMVPEGSEPAPNQEKPAEGEPPNGGEEAESTLLDRTVNSN